MTVDTTNPESIASMVLPTYLSEDSDRTRFISYMVTGFTISESCQLLSISHTTFLRWKETDPEFNQIVTQDMQRLRRDLSRRYLDIEFTRNFHLVLERDQKLLLKAVLTPDSLTTKEEEYIAKIRAMYTPQQLGHMKDLADDKDTDRFSWIEAVLKRKITTPDGTVVEEEIQSRGADR